MTDHNENVEVAENTMLGDLMKCVLEQVKALPRPWDAMSEEEQDEFLQRIEKQCRSACDQAVNIIACMDTTVIDAELESVTFKDGIKAVIKVSAHADGRHDLADAEGGQIRVIIPPRLDLSDEGKPTAEPDQRALNIGHEYNNQESTKQSLEGAMNVQENSYDGYSGSEDVDSEEDFTDDNDTVN